VVPRMSDYVIEPMEAADWPFVRAIYLEGLAGGDATFETEAPGWPEWDAAHRADCRLVARAGSVPIGWAALSPVSRRHAYRGVAEVSVYVAAPARGQGVGKALLQALVTASEGAGIWTLQASIFPENEASMALHLACGFRQVGYRERIGRLHGAWRSTILVERRSEKVGFNH
jgi:L-amino acid N-acyltransferase YncA